MKQHLVHIVFISVVISMVLACGSGSGGEKSLSDPSLRRAASCDETETFIKKTITAEIQSSVSDRSYYYWGGAIETADNSLDGASGETGDDKEIVPEHSDTTVQEEGVDEADIVKNDGNYIYVISNGYFVVLKSWPASELAEVSRTAISGYAYDMYVAGDRAVVFSTVYDDITFNDGSVGPRSYSFLKISIFDISDRAAPALAREVYVEGYYASSRMIGSRVYVLASSYLYGFGAYDIMYGPYYDGYVSGDYSADEIGEIVNEQLEEVSLVDILPKYYDIRYSGDGNVEKSDQICACENFYIPETMNGRTLTSLITLDASDDAAPLESASIFSDNGQVYVSRENLYMAATNYWGWINISPMEESFEMKEETFIHKFKLGSEPEYLGSGSVEGYVPDHFSMGEYEDRLRVATTLNNWSSSEESSNNVYVLREENGGLAVTGSITGIAPGERIYAARFIGERGYVVTFRQVDPLYTLDLSDPANPVIAGELHMPGYSTYLHPLGEDHLMGIGQNADESGTIDGLQLAIYDVSDIASPVRTHHLVIGESWYTSSEALYSHKAFQYYEPLKLLSLPVSHWAWGPSGDDGFNGAILYGVGIDTGFTKKGEVDHGNFYSPDDGIWQYDLQVRRSVFIGTGDDFYLYTISGSGVKANDVDSLDATPAGAVELPHPDWDEWVWGVDTIYVE